ncbi:alpha/beta hydrolase [Paroceanicella profunda]|uniref:Alpha/beta hydrolase n=1 Tax=Paroceanicella profunda TaxID=2579971 RepID=A0A5B8G013_9RHOB|nr:alpha/beta hydrolase [Paroceanicella profunda]QDL91813.1 alpha/beta hydrolase [Paroceanicella profunda]
MTHGFLKAGAAILALATGSAEAGPVLYPDAAAFVAATAKGAPIYTLSPADAREVLHGAQSGPVAAPAVDIEDRTLPVGPTGTTKIRILRPAGLGDAAPAVVYFHGAGWVMGDTLTHDRLVREIAAGAGAVVIFVEYERSPEARYPVAVEQDYAVTRHVAEHPEEFGIDPARIAIAGDSVGGNMTAVVSLLAKERGAPALVAQLLFYPVTDAGLDTPSYAQFAEGPWLTRAAMAWFWDQYLPEEAAREDIHVSPLNATPGQLAGLPPALVITSANDVLRDEGEAYAAKLIAAGVPTVQTRYAGTIHDFVMLNALADLPGTRAAIAQATGFLRDRFAAR